MQMAVVVEMEALQLPDIVTRVLQHVDSHQRITCCSLVSHTWNTAAGAATRSIYIRSLSGNKVKSLQGWLARHDSHLTSLTVRQYQGERASRGGFSLVSRIAPCLQQLQQLTLSDVKMTAPLSQEQISALSCNLTSLTALTVHTYQADARAKAVRSLCFLSGLRRLQDLQFNYKVPTAVITAANPRILPASLTRLALVNDADKVQVGTASVLPLLTNLQHLYVSEIDPRIQLGASVLSQLVQLTMLVYRISYAMNHAYEEEWSKTDRISFLSGVHHLTKLHHLEICYIHRTASPIAEQYSALTSSSNLTHLTMRGWLVPGDYLHHMFPLGQQFAAMKVLDVAWQYVVGKRARGSLMHIISACANLQELTVRCSAKDSEQLKQLTQLSSLTSLIVRAQYFQGFVPALMQLAKLRELELWVYKSDVDDVFETSDASDDSDSNNNGAANSWSIASLLELRHLTQLTRLWVGPEVCSELKGPRVWLKEKSSSPEVWEQLNTEFDEHFTAGMLDRSRS